MKHLFIGGPADTKWLDVDATQRSTLHVTGADGWDYQYNAIRVIVHNHRYLVYVSADLAPDYKLTPAIARQLAATRKLPLTVKRGIKIENAV